MTSPAFIVVVRVVAYAAFILLILWGYRSTRNRSLLLGHILGAGILVRAILGTALYVISFFELPVFTSLQRGAGFWVLAIDAQWYFQSAATAAARGLSTIQDGSASPAFVGLLALWMRLFGTSPATAVLLNLACYVSAAVLIVRFGSSIRVAALALIALTCSPALLIFGTQPLKDTVCVLLILLAATGARLWIDGISRSLSGDGLHATRGWTGLLGGAGLLAVATYGFGGIRAYVALTILVALGLTGAVATYASRRDQARWATPSAYALLMMVLFVAYGAGAGSYATTYWQTLGGFSPAAFFGRFDSLRDGFVRSGGDTALARMDEQKGLGAASGGMEEPGPLNATLPDAGEPAVPGESGSIQTSTRTRVERLAVGLSAFFIPISVLQRLSLVTFDGGRGLLFVTDLDTLFIDAVILGSLGLLIASRPGSSSMLVIVFLLALALITIVAMAYVVTNFGTLFRLRLIAVSPLWFLPVVVRATQEVDGRSRGSSGSFVLTKANRWLNVWNLSGDSAPPTPRGTR